MSLSETFLGRATARKATNSTHPDAIAMRRPRKMRTSDS